MECCCSHSIPEFPFTIHHSPFTIHIFSLVLAYRAVAQRKLVILIVILPRGTKPVPGTCSGEEDAKHALVPSANFHDASGVQLGDCSLQNAAYPSNRDREKFPTDVIRQLPDNLCNFSSVPDFSTKTLAFFRGL
jgi:hypothetical protein